MKIVSTPEPSDQKQQVIWREVILTTAIQAVCELCRYSKPAKNGQGYTHYHERSKTNEWCPAQAIWGLIDNLDKSMLGCHICSSAEVTTIVNYCPEHSPLTEGVK